ncbi:TlpA family protein disulfide reductase [Flavobacteriaceae bacterium LMO-SS05]
MRFFAAFLLLLTTLNCKHNTGEHDDYAFLGGQIINPSNDYVLLYNPKDEVDTLYLDHNNRFLRKLSNFESGLYTFVHGGEFQWILLEPKDSLLLRLNTIDFDESLVFTGNGARKNNYLIKTFLENEADNYKFRKWCQLEPEKFEQVLDSVRTIKLDEFHTFLSQKEYSELFKTIAKTSINYNYYASKEMYPFGYYGYGNLIHYKDLPDGFYDFRKDIDYNIEALSDFYTYNKFLYSHFNNLALQKFYKTATHQDIFNSKSVIYNLEKLNLIDSLVSSKMIKNNLLKFTTRDFISSSKDSLETKQVLNSFLQKTSSEKDKEIINSLVYSIKGLKQGNKLPPLVLIDYTDQEVMLDSIITKPTVIYFWSSTLPLLMKNTHFKVSQLRTKFPNIDFVGININDNDNSHWKNILDQYNFPVAKEFQFRDPNKAHEALAINSVNKSILVGKDIKIINANALLFTSEFEEQLKELVYYKE